MKTLTKIGLISLLIASIASTASADEGLTGYLKLPYNIEQQNVIPEPNAFYTLPGGISGYTFIDFEKEFYFGKSFLTTQPKKGISIKGEFVHINEPITEAGVGFQTDIPTPGESYANIYFLPQWTTQGKMTAGYFFQTTLPLGINFSTFGSWETLKNNLKNPQWSYGEIEIGKDIKTPLGTITVIYNPMLLSQENGGPTPMLEHRVGINLPF
jgi:hypothetical protein